MWLSACLVAHLFKTLWHHMPKETSRGRTHIKHPLPTALNARRHRQVPCWAQVFCRLHAHCIGPVTFALSSAFSTERPKALCTGAAHDPQASRRTGQLQPEETVPIHRLCRCTENIFCKAGTSLPPSSAEMPSTPAACRIPSGRCGHVERVRPCRSSACYTELTRGLKRRDLRIAARTLSRDSYERSRDGTVPAHGLV